MSSKTIKLVLPGRVVATSDAPELRLQDFLKVETVHAARVEATARGGGDTTELDAADDDVVELEFENGVRQWTSVAQLRADLRQGEAGPLHVPALMPGRDTARGISDWVLKGLKVLHISPAEKLADVAADAIIGKFEDNLTPPPGLYRISDPFTIVEKITKDSKLDTESPYLLFIHGTASSTAGAFGGLAGTPEWSDLQKCYGTRILALDHRTLSVSPIQNAIDLVTLLPVGAKLHMVSHSRGGLIGEMLCRGPVLDSDLQPFQDGKHDNDIKMLRELADLLKTRQLQIERFVRVACPAKGTILASGRLDLYFSTILNLIGYIPVLAESPLYAFVKATLLELARTRANPAQVPGLEAQMPESPLVHLLNRPGVTSDADLAVIAGDIQGEGFLGRLKVFATDLFYLEDHDLIVNTASMYGGVNRKNGVHYFFDRGAEVNHFNYFINANTRQRMCTWIIKGADANYKVLLREPTDDIKSTDYRGAKPPDLPVIFLLPGMMGTHLKDAAGRIWLDAAALALGGMDRLRIDKDVRTDGLVASLYGGIVQFLQSANRVIPFAYDWRRSVLEEGDRLAAEIAKTLKETDQPVRILAHSMGGMVARAMIARHPDLWKELCQKHEGRLVMLGTPNHGTLAIARLLLGRDRLFRILRLLDFGPPTDLAGILRAFPGLLEMLPLNAECGIDLAQESAWKDLTPTPPAQANLDSARATWTVLEAAVDAEHMIYVAGTAPVTPCRLTKTGAEQATTLGDGRVSYELGQLKGVPTWYMAAEHGEMANDPASFPALLDLVNHGKTDRLSTQPHGSTDIFPMPASPPLLFPGEDDLVNAALARRSEQAQGERIVPVRLWVSHGSLEFASFPVAIGHYDNDTIVNAEKFLDRQLGGALSRRRQLGSYPGPMGTVEAIHAPSCQPPGALIIGLGDFGTLNREKLTAGVTRAALRYALAVAEDQSGYYPATGSRSAAFSAVLIGTNGVGDMGPEDSVAAVVKGVIMANRRLREQGMDDRVQIDAVEFVELYENLALHAAHALCSIEENIRLSLTDDWQRLEPDPRLRLLPGRLRRQPVLHKYANNWWRRVEITAKKNGDLQFVALTDRARAEIRHQFLQRRLIDGFVKESITTTAYNPDFAATLFELLLPNTFKAQTVDTADLVLVVDAESAQYPWELLAQRAVGQPLAVRCGILRQLMTADYRDMQAPRADYALVIGDPPSEFPPLEAAAAEANEVAGELEKAGYKVMKRVKADAAPLKAVTELFARDYRIVHLAGHGNYDEDDPKKSGMVLGKNRYLTAAEIGQLPVVPDLVFINCCHLGKIVKPKRFPRVNKMAASIAEELIKMGVRAVVAAGWAVEDEAARLFARTFYRAMLYGQSFGNAVLAARQETYRKFPKCNTWGAYQCYGDPSYLLTPVAAGISLGGSGAGHFVSLREFEEELDDLCTLCAEVRSGRIDGGMALRQRIAETHKARTLAWDNGRIHAGFGRCWADLGDYDLAIDAFHEALNDPAADAPLQVVEQLVQQLILRADAWIRAQAASRETPKALAPLQEARGQLESLLIIRETPERLSALGDVDGRLARITTADAAARRKHLGNASKSYKAAYAAAEANEKLNLGAIYAGLSWVALDFLLAASADERTTAKWLAIIARCEQAAAESAVQEANSARPLYAAHAALLRHLIADDLRAGKADPNEAAKSLIVAYRLASSQRVAAIDHLEFFMAVLQAKDPATVKTLQQIRAALDA